MKVNRLESRGDRFSVTINNRQDLDDYCTGLGPIRRRALSYGFERTGVTVTTRSRDGLIKVAGEMQKNIEPTTLDKIRGLGRVWMEGEELEQVLRAQRIGQLATELRTQIRQITHDEWLTSHPQTAEEPDIITPDISATLAPPPTGGG